MKKILWFCNCPITDFSENSTGTWLSAMAQVLIRSGEVELAVVSQTRTKDTIRKDCGAIRQWLLPLDKTDSNGLPPEKTLTVIQSVVNDVQPDLIHIWGTENYWGMLTCRGLISVPTILEMQGIMYACADVFYGGLNLSELIRCIGPLEVLSPGNLLYLRKRSFERWGKFEKEIIQGHDNISTQSEWVRSHVRTVNPKAKLFKTGIILRKEFYTASAWSPQLVPDNSSTTVFTISAGATAYKGLHVLLRAIAILKHTLPNIKLIIAGHQIAHGIRKSGYVRWLESEIHRLRIKAQIHWLGPLDAIEIIKHIQQSSMVVIPSFIESYCLSLAETMLLGAPLVVSYAGAMPELARDEESALFFPPGDEVACASRIGRLILDKDLAIRLGRNARKVALKRNEVSGILAQQLRIYTEVFANSHFCNDERSGEVEHA